MILLKKAVRAVLKNKLSYLACIFLIGIGVLFYSSMMIIFSVVSQAKQQFYTDYNFADVFADVKAIPDSAVNRLKRIDGIKDVSLRLVVEAKIDESSASLKLVSYTGDEKINGINIKKGKMNDKKQIFLPQNFITANNYNIGDEIKLIIKGKKFNFIIAGAAESPEFIFLVKNMSDIIPDSKGYGFGYIDTDMLKEAAQMKLLNNNICFVLENGFTYDDVKEDIKKEISEYGLISLYSRKDHMSEAFVSQQVESLRGMAYTIPTVMIGMAIIMLVILLKRTVEKERIQIGTLKAFGYSNSLILCHYMYYGLFVGAVGGITGGFLGSIIAESYIQIYINMLNLPVIEHGFYYNIFAKGILIGSLAGMFGTMYGARNIIKLNPAESMRPKSPNIFHKSIVKGNKNKNQYFVMALRNIERNKMRSLFLIIGIIFSFSIITYMTSYKDILSVIMSTQYDHSMIYDAEIVLLNTLGYKDAVYEAESLKETIKAEGILEISGKIKNSNLQEDAVITGLKSNAELYKIYDYNTHENFELKGNGIILSSMLAEKLNAEADDILFFETPLLTEDIKLKVTDIVAQYTGLNAYMNIDYLSNMFSSKTAVSKIQIKTNNIEKVKEKYKEASNVINVLNKYESKQKSIDYVNSTSSMVTIMFFMSILIAFAIIYSISNISLEEQKKNFQP